MVTLGLESYYHFRKLTQPTSDDECSGWKQFRKESMHGLLMTRILQGDCATQCMCYVQTQNNKG